MLANGEVSLSFGGSYEAPWLARGAGLPVEDITERFGFAPMPAGPADRRCSSVGWCTASRARRTGPKLAMELLKEAVAGRAILEILYSSGLRVSELVGLDWRDIDDEIGMLTVRAGKGAKDRVVPIGEPALDALKAWRPLLLSQPILMRRSSPICEALGLALVASRRLSRDGFRCGYSFADHAAWHPALLRDSYARCGRGPVGRRVSW